MPTYEIRIPDPARARAAGAFAFSAQSAEGMAGELQAALSGTGLFERWRGMQDDPDAVDPALGVTDPAASVSGRQDDLAFDLTATTTISGEILRHRLRLLAGGAWELRNVR
ncbi:hypothetical protein [Xanthomonas sp. XNM01]|uniref:hypothetical protein n=1 Tax=Xanthomonas sp. XNM01 TaxID=2769289 RepID=UPI00177FAE0D|nr:hypothetical protein [Xanthomonas sp. XNM01]MBD9370038.1 hypothetical protein [Xanthomonas sp. XNM01]